MAAEGKYGSKSLIFLVGGYNLLPAKVQSVRAKVSSVVELTDGGGDSWEECTPVGFSRAELEQNGAFFDTTTVTGIHVAFSGAQETLRVVCLGLAGQTIGHPFDGFEGAYAHAYEAVAALQKLQRANVLYSISGKRERGYILHALTTDTADGNTDASSVDNATVPAGLTIPITSSSVANPSVITTPVPHGLTTGDSVVIAGHSGSTPSINGEHTVTVVSTTTFTIPVNVTVGGTGGTFRRGKTVNGGYQYLQWTDLVLGGHTNALVTVRHSSDNVTFADKQAFTAATATLGAERVAISGTINRYTSTSLDFTGAGSSPSMTYFVGLVRNP